MPVHRARNEALLFFAVVLAASFFLFWGPLALFQVPTISFVSQTRGPGWAIALFILGGFVPSLAGLALTGLREGRAGVARLLRSAFRVRMGARWYAAALGLALLAAAGQLALLQLLGQAFDLGLFAAQLGSFLPLLILGPLSEELGWRGYAQPRLQQAWGPLAASLAVGLAWALWHLPLFFLPGTAQNVMALPFLPFLLTLVCESIGYGWLYAGSGSLWSAVVLHWMSTYLKQVLATGVQRTPLYNTLEFVPSLLIALLVLAVWKPWAARPAPTPARNELR